MLSTDVRTQTEYGTLRAYIKAGWQFTSGLTPAQGDNGSSNRSKDGGVYTERAFIQFAGFTFGKSQSFFDLWSAASVANSNLWGYDDTGNGINLAAYTAMLGNGFSLSLAVEDPQAYRRMNLYAGPFVTTTAGALNNLGWGSVGNNEYGGTSVPDIVGVFRVDQAWGSILAGGLVHQINPVYYHGNVSVATVCPGQTTVGCYDFGAPDVKYGWAATLGGDFNLPWAKGDRFLFQATYTEGVMGTVMGGQNNTSIAWWKGNGGTGNGTLEATLGWIVDAVRPLDGEFQLTSAWAVIAGIEHYWTPSLRSSLFGDYVAIRYNDTAKATLCSGIPLTAGTCNPDLNLWNVGSRTVWTPVPNLDISVEGVYSFVDQNNVGITALNAGVMTTTTRSLVDQGIWSANFRVQRNFWP
jgi:hypothetical protein